MKWEDKDVEFLKDNYVKEIPLEEISAKMSRSLRSIERKAQNLGLHRKWVRFNKPVKRFSREEIDKRYYKNNREKVYRRKMDRRKRLKEEVVNMLGGKCKICGYNKCFAALDFHHQKSDKEGDVSVLIKNGSRQKLLKEAEKCILLCANCHRELHNKGL